MTNGVEFGAMTRWGLEDGFIVFNIYKIFYYIKSGLSSSTKNNGQVPAEMCGDGSLKAGSHPGFTDSLEKIAGSVFRRGGHLCPGHSTDGISADSKAVHPLAVPAKSLRAA